jgi:transposase-like protein
MNKRGKVLKKQRVFSEEFKKLRVKEFEKGEFSVLELSKLYGVVHQTVYTWIYKYSTYNRKGLRIVEMKSSSKTKVKELQDRIKELERVVGQKQLNIDYLEKMIEIAKEELDIDIKKKYNTPQSTGFGNTGKKQDRV